MTESTSPRVAREVGERDGKTLYAIGSSIIDEDELAAIVKAYDEVEVDVTLDRELGEPLVGLDVQRKADEVLRARGINPVDASQAELLDSLTAVSS